MTICLDCFSLFVSVLYILYPFKKYIYHTYFYFYIVPIKLTVFWYSAQLFIVSLLYNNFSSKFTLFSVHFKCRSFIFMTLEKIFKIICTSILQQRRIICCVTLYYTGFVNSIFIFVPCVSSDWGFCYETTQKNGWRRHQPASQLS
jgi:hypothetical protein